MYGSNEYSNFYTRTDLRSSGILSAVFSRLSLSASRLAVNAVGSVRYIHCVMDVGASTAAFVTYALIHYTDCGVGASVANSDF
ncbi:hypothetical protein E2C01_019751 [Portunus trituberculatus]|uniref:Uncharacterized protein n=1 Tax=Portunus trituberculatus TaxID=210409 RepID=A0A5B7DZU3_PORTR|nr:hypothetical protein [Portunus trituberculatus]